MVVIPSLVPSLVLGDGENGQAVDQWSDACALAPRARHGAPCDGAEAHETVVDGALIKVGIHYILDTRSCYCLWSNWQG